ncbi:MAG TPA: ribosomal protein S18-alanine N-acetyltransferase [Plasticicumulans sp.]|nr:ribosomal protein S18-alanine N-acetyltransferase [Plasticicumulans sp.]
MNACVRPELPVRPMTIADVPAVIGVEEIAYAYPWTEGIFRDCLRSGYHGYVQEDSRGVVAYAMITVAVGEAHLLNLAVAPRHQGGGRGRALLRYVCRQAVALGADIMFLEVRPSNVQAVALYLDEGFCEVGARRGYYPAAIGREDALVMARTLV